MKQMIPTFSFGSVTKEQILESEFVVISIGRKEVETLNFNRISEIFSILRELKTKAFRKLIITFDGYEDTSEEVYEILQIRKYMFRLFFNYPYMFYFISTFDLNLRILLACISDVVKKTDVSENTAQNLIDIICTDKNVVPVQFKYVIPSNVLTRMISSTLAYCNEIGETRENTIRLISELINPSLGPTSNIETFEFARYMKDDLYDIFSECSRELWNAWVGKVPVKIFVSEKQIHSFVADNKSLLFEIIEKTKIIKQVSIGQKYTNLFAFKGFICDECKEGAFLIIKKEVKRENNVSEFLPNINEYIKQNIFPFSSEYRDNMPIPIDKTLDRKFCMKCRTISFI